MKKIKITKRFKEKAEWFNSFSEDNFKLEAISDSLIEDKQEGYSALECFFSVETFGKQIPCKEINQLRKLLEGKWKHGITVENCARSFALDRILFSKEIKENYPKWVAVEIFKQAEKIALKELGYIPTFILNRKDFSEN